MKQGAAMGVGPEGPAAEIEASARQLRRQPAFRPVLADYCRAMAEKAPMQWPVYKLFDQFDRYVACYLLIHNYYAWRHAGGPPPTLSLLQRFTPSSERQTAGLIAALKAGRLVLAEPDPGNRRVRHLRPAPAVIEEVGRSFRFFAAAADAAEGRPPGQAALLERQPDALGDMIRRSAAYVLAHGTLIHPFPRVLHFAKRDCGYLLLVAILGAHYAQTLPGAPPAAPLSYRALAQRFQVSPAHIGNLLGEAQQRQWFSTGAGGRLLTISATLVEEFEQWGSWQMVHCAALAEETKAFFAAVREPGLPASAQ